MIRRAYAALGAALLALVCGACAASALDASARTLGAVHAAQAETVALVEARQMSELRETCGDALDRVQCADEISLRYVDVADVLNASAQTIDSLAALIGRWASDVIAGAADEDTPPANVCASLSELSTVAGAWLDVAGVSFPVPIWSCD